MSTTGAVLEWDVSDIITKPGTYEFFILYTKGWKAVNIDWAAFVNDNKEVSKDKHKGMSGSKKENIIYTLNLKKYNKKSKYSIKANLTCKGGTDSNGIVFIQKK